MTDRSLCFLGHADKNVPRERTGQETRIEET